MANRLFHLGVIPGIAVAAMAIAAGVWGSHSEFPLQEGSPLGNKEFISFREGWDFRVALCAPAPVFGLRTSVPTKAQLEAEEKAWGRPNHWLRLPEFDFSLWWPFALSWVATGFWLARRRPARGRGFPVEVARCPP